MSASSPSPVFNKCAINTKAEEYILQRTQARTLRSQDAISARKEMLKLPHIVPLCGFCQQLRAEGRGLVPDFDPLDGGVNANFLFLMEKPGPMTDHTRVNGQIGSGFISRDNNDATAEAILRFTEVANIDRKRSVLWNTVPWWNGTRDISTSELIAGTERLARLIDILPNLRVVVGVGAKARAAKKMIELIGLPFISSAHPSPINRARRRSVWDAIPSQWERANNYLADIADVK